MNESDAAPSPVESLYDLLAEAARRDPDHVAIDFMGEQMTYGDLLDASSRVATFLMNRGIGPGHRVGFYYHKCFDALACLFAIMRTGATYVAFDLELPIPRILKICRQCGIRVMVAGALPQGLQDIDWAIVSEPSGAELPDGETIAVSDVLSDSPPADEPPARPAGDVANLIYTSGSTGRPKGVMITTQSLLHFSKWAVETFGITADDRVANHAPYSFDLSTFDIFAAVRAGATMCPFPDVARGHPYRTARFIAAERITVWYSVPWCLVLMVLRGSLSSHDLSRLRHVLFAGEVMPVDHLRSLMIEVPHASYWNLYGPTETNVCTYHRVTPEDLEDPEGIPIGRPIADTRVWVVDDKLRPVEPGTSGELLVAGPTILKGYFHDKRATARRLVDAPDGQGKACKTGDRVVQRRDGVLMFQGRFDRLIKCRGYRIELSEVEAVAAEHPAVAEVAVVANHHFLRGTSLTGFVAVREGNDLSANDLNAFCRESLPKYMLPQHWEIVDRLPRNPHGKIDLTNLSAQAK